MANSPETGKETIVSLDRVSLKYGDFTALDDIRLQIRTGEFFTLLGPSGCGKTSLLQLIGGFQDPSSGTITIGGKDVTHVPPHSRAINTVFQNFALFPHMNIAANVRFGLEMLGWPKQRAQARVDNMLNLVGLQGFETRFPHELSGGQQQRAALARALAPEPRVLLLDEPMSALDLKLRKEMQTELKRLHKEAGITFIMVTHDQEEALALSDRIAVLRYGSIRQVATPEELYNRPASSFVADFVGEANLLPAELLGLGDKAKMVMVRPEAVVLLPAEQRGRFNGQVIGRRFVGHAYELTIALDSGQTVRAMQRSDVDQHLLAGERVSLDWDDSVHLLLES